MACEYRLKDSKEIRVVYWIVMNTDEYVFLDKTSLIYSALQCILFSLLGTSNKLSKEPLKDWNFWREPLFKWVKSSIFKYGCLEIIM